MPDRIGAALNVATTALHYLAGLPLGTQITGAATLLFLLGYFEYRRRTRTTPTLKTRAAHALAAGWKAARTPATPEQKEQRGNQFESLLFLFFTAVTFGLVMQGLIPFAKEDMGLTGPWPYLFFFALDGMAALFAYVAFRRAQQGGVAPTQRFMVAAITAGSSWFQWVHHTSQSAAGQVAWAAMPIGVAVLFETLLTQRRRAWKRKQEDSPRKVPAGRWLWDPVGSAGITRRTHMWNLDAWEEGLETHMTRAECVRRLRREFGLLWAWKVPADVAIRLKRGFKVDEAAAMVPQVIEAHRREVENRRLVKEAERAARAITNPTPGVYTVSIPEAPVVDLGPVPGVADAVEPLEPAPARWVDPSDEWDPLPDEDAWENPTDPAPLTLDTPKEEEPADPWDNALPADTPFTPVPAPALGTSPRTSVVTRETPPLLDNWEVPVLPTVNGRQTTPKPGEPAFQAAVDLYLDCEKHKIPMSGRELCRLNGVSPNNRLWCQWVIRAAKEQQAATTPTSEDIALF